MHNFYMFHGGTMWGNWSSTIRRTRLTPAYANSANLASDMTKNEPKYGTISRLHHVLNNYSSTILHTPLPIQIDTRRQQWAVTHNGSSTDHPITFVFNDADRPYNSSLGPGGKSQQMAARSAMIYDTKSGVMLWYSEPNIPDSMGVAYITDHQSALSWTQWAGSRGDWYRSSFKRPNRLPNGSQVSVNLTGFGQGNVFLNGKHLSFFNLQYGECFAPPGGVNPHGNCDTYISQACDRPTQDCYHIPPSWFEDDNELLVWSDHKLPPNVTEIQPSLASIVYRTDKIA